MIDIVERLNQMAVDVDRDVVNLAIAEIMRLRTSLEQLQATVQTIAAGIGTQGQNFADIRQDLRSKPQPTTWQEEH